MDTEIIGMRLIKGENHCFRFLELLGFLVNSVGVYVHMLRAKRGSQSLLTLFCHKWFFLNIEWGHWCHQISFIYGSSAGCFRNDLAEDICCSWGILALNSKKSTSSVVDLVFSNMWFYINLDCWCFIMDFSASLHFMCKWFTGKCKEAFFPFVRYVKNLCCSVQRWINTEN